MSAITSRYGNLVRSGRDQQDMHNTGVTNTRRTVVGLLAAVLIGGMLSACADDGDDQDGGGEPGAVGVVVEQEFLGHRLRDVPAEQAPTVELDAQPDPHGGWNLHLSTQRFTFTPPDQSGGQARAGRGHAHVYVEEQKFSRAYGQWFFLPAAAVGDGEHTVVVTLNADDHTVWAADGEPVTAEATVTGTTDSEVHGHGKDMPTASATTPAGDVELFEFQVAEGKASPPLDRATVDRGATVRIVVTSDQPDEVHLHGYDLSAAVGSGEQGVIEFVADQAGLFELESHENGLVLLQLQVR